MRTTFRVGITPDFYTDAKGRFEAALESKLQNVSGLEFAPIPPQPNKVMTREAADQFDAIFALGTSFTAESVQGCQRLALIARWGVGYDMIDIQAINNAGILLAITPQAVRRPVAEAILAYIFALAKNIPENDRITREGKWRGQLSRLGTCLEGRTLGSIGCGNIAQEMFRLASGLGFSRFLAHDPYANPDAAAKLNVELTSIDHVFRDSDFVAVNCLLNQQTRGLIGAEHFRLMKPSAFFINTARGAIVRQADLTQALRERWILGAGIDVFEKEPVDPTDPLLSLDNVILAPHALAWTEEIARDNGLEACDNILALFRGQIPHGAVNREVLNTPAFLRKLERYKQ
ncbi:MAG: NAD(P)-dependent oxidoreductase [Bryobacteraceae bacterium]